MTSISGELYVEDRAGACRCTRSCMSIASTSTTPSRRWPAHPLPARQISGGPCECREDLRLQLVFLRRRSAATPASCPARARPSDTPRHAAGAGRDDGLSWSYHRRGGTARRRPLRRVSPASADARRLRKLHCRLRGVDDRPGQSFGEGIPRNGVARNDASAIAALADFKMASFDAQRVRFASAVDMGFSERVTAALREQLDCIEDRPCAVRGLKISGAVWGAPELRARASPIVGSRRPASCGTPASRGWKIRLASPYCRAHRGRTAPNWSADWHPGGFSDESRTIRPPFAASLRRSLDTLTHRRCVAIWQTRRAFIHQATLRTGSCPG